MSVAHPWLPVAVLCAGLSSMSALADSKYDLARQPANLVAAFDYDEQNFLYDMRFAGQYAGLGFRL